MSGRFWLISFLMIVVVVLFGVKVILPKISLKKNDEEMKEMIVGKTKFLVSIADDADEMEKGLGYRDYMDEGQGMLFYYPRPVQPRFWMKGMRFDLDFVWIRDDVVVDITQNVPAPIDDGGELDFYSPKEFVNYVLEVNAGEIDENDIKVGDLVKLN